MLDTLLLLPSLHCNTSLHFTTLHQTTLHLKQISFSHYPGFSDVSLFPKLLESG